MPMKCKTCKGTKLSVKGGVERACPRCGATGEIPTPMEVLRKIMDGHKKCKNQCSLLGELGNWMRAYEKMTLSEIQGEQVAKVPSVKVSRRRVPNGTCKGCGAGIHMTESYCGECRVEDDAAPD